MKDQKIMLKTLRRKKGGGKPEEKAKKITGDRKSIVETQN